MFGSRMCCWLAVLMALCLAAMPGLTEEPPEVVWQIAVEGSAMLTGVCPLPDGGALVSGLRNPASEQGLYLACLDADGAVTWEKALPDLQFGYGDVLPTEAGYLLTGIGLAMVDGAGEVLWSAPDWCQELRIDGTVIGDRLYLAADSTLYCAGLDGALLWSVDYAPTDAAEGGYLGGGLYDVAIAPDGDLWLGGTIDLLPPGLALEDVAFDEGFVTERATGEELDLPPSQAWLLRVSAEDGALRWSCRYGDGFGQVDVLLPGEQGDVLAGGIVYADGPVALEGEPDAQPFDEIFHGLLFRVDAGGDELWRETLGASGFAVIRALARQSSGEVLVLAEGGALWENGVRQQAYCTRLGELSTIDGTVLWQRIYGGMDSPQNMKPTADGGYLIVGDLGDGAAVMKIR